MSALHPADDRRHRPPAGDKGRDDMTCDRLEATLTDEQGGVTELVLELYASFALPVGSRDELHEAACRAWIDGVPGAGQCKTQWPAAYIAALRESEA